MNKYFISIFIGAFAFTYGQNTHFNFTERPYIGILPTYVNTSVSTAVLGGKKSILIMGRDYNRQNEMSKISKRNVQKKIRNGFPFLVGKKYKN